MSGGTSQNARLPSCNTSTCCVESFSSLISFSSSRPRRRGPVNEEECYFWRTTGCHFGDKCRYKHFPDQKGQDRKPWQPWPPFPFLIREPEPGFPSLIQGRTLRRWYPKQRSARHLLDDQTWTLKMRTTDSMVNGWKLTNEAFEPWHLTIPAPVHVVKLLSHIQSYRANYDSI